MQLLNGAAQMIHRFFEMTDPMIDMLKSLANGMFDMRPRMFPMVSFFFMRPVSMSMQVMFDLFNTATQFLHDILLTGRGQVFHRGVQMVEHLFRFPLRAGVFPVSVRRMSMPMPLLVSFEDALDSANLVSNVVESVPCLRFLRLFKPPRFGLQTRQLTVQFLRLSVPSFAIPSLVPGAGMFAAQPRHFTDNLADLVTDLIETAAGLRLVRLFQSAGLGMQPPEVLVEFDPLPFNRFPIFSLVSVGLFASFLRFVRAGRHDKDDKSQQQSTATQP